MYFNTLFSMFGMHNEVESLGSVNIMLNLPGRDPNSVLKAWRYKLTEPSNSGYASLHPIELMDKLTRSMEDIQSSQEMNPNYFIVEEAGLSVALAQIFIDPNSNVVKDLEVVEQRVGDVLVTLPGVIHQGVGRVSNTISYSSSSSSVLQSNSFAGWYQFCMECLAWGDMDSTVLLTPQDQKARDSIFIRRECEGNVHIYMLFVCNSCLFDDICMSLYDIRICIHFQYIRCGCMLILIIYTNDLAGCYGRI